MKILLFLKSHELEFYQQIKLYKEKFLFQQNNGLITGIHRYRATQVVNKIKNLEYAKNDKTKATFGR